MKKITTPKNEQFETALAAALRPLLAQMAAANRSLKARTKAIEGQKK